MFKYLRIALYTIAAIGIEAHAEIKFNGFATFTGGMTTSDDKELWGHDDTLNFAQDSLLGLQASADLADNLSATAQIISRGENQWDAKLAWAYVTYEINDNIKIMAGKQRTPYYAYSDFLDVGFAYHWIYPPKSVYDQGLTSLNGIGTLITHQIGSIESTFQFIFGNEKDYLEIDGPNMNQGEIDNMTATNWSLGYHDFTFRLSYNQADMVIDFPSMEAFAGAWGMFGFAAIENRISSNDDDNTAQFMGMSANYDNGDFIFAAELTKTKIEGFLAADETESYYVSLGKRFGSLTPHITYGSNEDTAADTSFLDVVPSGMSAELDMLKLQTAGAFASRATDSEFWTLGLRWNFHSSAALKVEFTSMKDNLLLEDETTNLFAVGVATVF